jgi:two-component system, OmpR family, sensor histidine kinase KdpD
MRVKAGFMQSAAKYAVVVGLVAAIVAFYKRVAMVNPTTVALTFLLAVLVVSAYWGLRYSVALALLATLNFNFFFLPPFGTFTIADPQNWAALFAFLVTAIIASQLSERARHEAMNANQRRRDVERLYAFSQRLLATDNMLELLNAIPGYVCEIIGARTASIYLVSAQEIYRSDPRSEIPSVEEMRAASARGDPVMHAENGLVLAPIRLGARVTGMLALSGELLSRETLEAVGGLIAIAIERVGAIEKLSKAEAARESENLRTALLDSVTHELRTPLTGIKAAVTSLLSNFQLDETQRKDLLAVINEESDRLNRLVGEAAEMSQLEGHVELALQLTSVAAVIQQAVEQSRGVLGQHPVEIRAASSPPQWKMDAARVVEILKQLLENAAKYSPPDAPITITAELSDEKLLVSVADQGPGIDEFEQSLIFDKFYRGRDQRYKVQGTGMGLAIAKAIVEAHGGTIGVTSQLGRGSVFHFSFHPSAFIEKNFKSNLRT